jgi:hypothetical protein
MCSVGSLPPRAKRCPTPPPTPESAYQATRGLNEPVHVTAVLQPHKSCSAAFLLDPCYRAELEFKAPYAVTSAASEYDVAVESTCHNARPSSWGIIHSIRRDETVRTVSTGYFNCTFTDEFEVCYLIGGLRTPSAGAPHESVIVGTGTLGQAAGAALPDDPRHRARRSLCRVSQSSGPRLSAAHGRSRWPATVRPCA